MASSSTSSGSFTLDDLDAFLNEADNNYSLNWRNMVSNAYSDAFGNVKAKLAEQEAENKARAEMLASVVSLAVLIPIGGWMSARLGQVKLSAMMGDVALGGVLKINKAALYKVADYVIDSDAASYMLTTTFDAVAKKVNKEVLAAAAAGLKQDPFRGVSVDLKSEMRFFTQLDTWVRSHSAFLRAIASHARGNPAMTDADRSELAGLLIGSRYIQSQPKSTCVRNHKGAVDSIELMLWMGLMLKMDYVEKSFENWRKHSTYTDWRKAGDIDALPGAKTYPKEVAADPKTHLGGVRIGHRAPGGKVLDRIEELYGPIVGGRFLRGTGWPNISSMESMDGFNGGEMQRAVQAIPIVAESYLKKTAGG